MLIYLNEHFIQVCWKPSNFTVVDLQINFPKCSCCHTYSFLNNPLVRIWVACQNYSTWVIIQQTPYVKWILLMFLVSHSNIEYNRNFSRGFFFGVDYWLIFYSFSCSARHMWQYLHVYGIGMWLSECVYWETTTMQSLEAAYEEGDVSI